MRKNFLILFLLFGLVGVLSAEIRKAVLLHTSDIHARLTKDQAARLTTVISRETMAAGGRDAVLLVDTGDLIQGSLAGSVTNGRIAIEFLNANGYQAWIPGNHDFEFGFAALLSCRRAFQGDALAANLQFNGIEAYFRGWKMYTVNNLKVALVGLTYPFQQQIFPPGSTAFRLEDFRPALDRIIPQVMAAAPDIIVLGVHYGMSGSFEPGDNSLFALAAAYPQINVVLGGHTHQIVPGRRLGASSWYQEPGKHGEGVMVTTVEWDTDRKAVVQVRSRFSPSAPVKDAESCPTQVMRLARQTVDFGLRPVGELHCSGGNSASAPFTPLHQLWGVAALAGAKADVAFISPSRIPDKLPSGKINEFDLYQLAPYEDELIVLPLTREEIKVVLEEQLSLLKKANRISHLQAPFGFTAVCDAAGRVDKMEFTNVKPVYRVVFSGFTLAGAKRHLPQLNRILQTHMAERQHTGVNLRQALREYLAKNSPVTVGVPGNLRQE